jgi:hypothetical protein
MLNKMDDFPIHQTPEPLAQPATSDRNFYDRTWFNGYSPDGEWYFGIGMAIYPHRGVLDCAFSVVQRGGRQHSFFGSRRAPLERTEMQVGPFRIHVHEPMRRTRVVLDDNKTGLSCDLTFSARTMPTQEDRQTLWNGTRRVMDATRFDQFGRWSGLIRHPDGEIKVEETSCLGTKDRSWGIRGVGEPETGGAPQGSPAGIFFLWAPLIWEDHASNAIFFDGTKGERFFNEGMTTPFYENEKAIPETSLPTEQRMQRVEHRLRYQPGSRWIDSAEIDLIDLQKNVRTISFEPVLRFHMRGLGYHHPHWIQGAWQGELEIAGESFDPLTLDPLKPENFHVQQVSRVSDGQRSGIGALEHVCFGPYAPYGFQEFSDGARS